MTLPFLTPRIAANPFPLILNLLKDGNGEVGNGKIDLQNCPANRLTYPATAYTIPSS